MSPSARSFGFEAEYASGADLMSELLYEAGMLGAREQHGYHCDCEHCLVDGTFNVIDPDTGDYAIDPETGRRKTRPAWPLRHQRDSTADGEFITRVLRDWDEAAEIVAALTTAAQDADATTSNRCGLHVHVGSGDTAEEVAAGMSRSRIVPLAYLAFERYFTEIVAPGASIRKRDMNSTLMQALRNYVADNFGGNMRWQDIGRGQAMDILLGTIGRDRHVDLNWSRRHQTWEFRVFNATNAAWRIELACRLSVAFVEQAGVLVRAVEQQVRGSKYWPEECDSPWGEILRPAWSNLPAPHPTKRPVVSMEDFIEILSECDPALRPLIERQRQYMLTRFATQVVPAA